MKSRLRQEKLLKMAGETAPENRENSIKKGPVFPLKNWPFLCAEDFSFQSSIGRDVPQVLPRPGRGPLLCAQMPAIDGGRGIYHQRCGKCGFNLRIICLKSYILYKKALDFVVTAKSSALSLH
mgnify:CR=1 FL=1